LDDLTSRDRPTDLDRLYLSIKVNQSVKMVCGATSRQVVRFTSPRPTQFSQFPSPSQALTANALDDILNKGATGLTPLLQIWVRPPPTRRPPAPPAPLYLALLVRYDIL